MIRARGMAAPQPETNAAIGLPEQGGDAQLQQAEQEDPDAGIKSALLDIETALRNAKQYGEDVAKTVFDNFTLGAGDEFRAVVPATIKFIMAGPEGKKSWGDHFDDEMKSDLKRADKFLEESPVTANLAIGTGMGLPALLTAGAAMGPVAVRAGVKMAGKAITEPLKRPSFVSRAAGGLAAGAGLSGAHAFNTGQGGVAERMENVSGAMTVGGVAGAMIPAVGLIARGAISHLQKRVVAKRAGIKTSAPWTRSKRCWRRGRGA